MVLLYETKKAKGKGCTMIRNGKKPFPKPAFDLTIKHQGGSYQYKSVQRGLQSSDREEVIDLLFFLQLERFATKLPTVLQYFVQFVQPNSKM